MHFFRGGRKKKLVHAIRYPCNLDLSSYCDQMTETDDYSLSAVMIHEGTEADSGHYYDLIRSPVPLSPTKKEPEWFKYNDEVCLQCWHQKLQVVESTKAPGVAVDDKTAKKATPDLKGCYCLVYRKPEIVTKEMLEPPEEIAEPIRGKVSDESMWGYYGYGIV